MEADDLRIGKYIPYPYQVRAFNQIRECIGRLKRQGKPAHIIAQAPCGAGKSLLQALIARGCANRGKKFMFIVAGRSLVSQTSERFMEYGIQHGVVMADSENAVSHDFAVHNQKSFFSMPALIASRETYGSRVLNRKIIHGINLDVISLDEIHNGIRGNVYGRILKENADKVIIGFTATPATGNGKGLGAPFQEVVHLTTHEELLQGGFLVPPVCYGPRVVDMSGVPIDHKTGDFVQSQAEKRWDKDELHGDLLRDWKRYSQNRPTVCFAQGVEHSKHIAANFNGHGIPAVHIDADTPLDERVRYYGQLESGELKLISNYGVAAYGVDLPFVGCVLLARSIGSLTSYLQITGRGGRSCKSVYWMGGEKKQDFVLIDFGGNIKKHGWPQLDRYWPLGADETVEEFTAKKREEKKEPPEMPLLHCSKCGCEWLASATKKGCPNCGYKKDGNGLATTFNGEELVRIKKAAAAKPIVDDQKAFAACLGICANTGRSLSQAIAIFERKHSKRFSKSNAMPIENYTEVKRMMGEGRSIAEILRMPVSKVIPGFARKKKSVAGDSSF